MSMTYDTAQNASVSGCVNAPSLALYRTNEGIRLGRKRDGLMLPGGVRGGLDRARRCWHALSVLHTDAEQIIQSIDADERAAALLADWARLTD